MAVLTTRLLPKLKSSPSAIINLSSFLGETPAPYSSLYSATKAFNTYFSESVSLERGL
jgi:17beta-estradiol 17-dehydrogenase / very-long-chain 3-oxoacyl-CoA reductase